VKPHETLDWAVDLVAIDRARVLQGWTRRELARNSHVDEGALCDLFAGRRRPTFGTLRAICRSLDLSLDQVIGFAGAVISCCSLCECIGPEYGSVNR